MATNSQFNIHEAKADTLAIIFSGYSSENYLVDIRIATAMFTQYGISPSNVHIFLPDSVNTKIAVQNTQGLPNVHEVNNFATVMPTLQGRFAFISVTGHGDIDGICIQDGNNPKKLGAKLSPHDFLVGTRSIQNLEIGIVTLGQCYAGIFNFIDATKHPQLCLLGATGLHSSLNSPIKEYGWPNLNVFLGYFHLAVACHPDIDGDGRISLMDAFKFAGAKTSQLILNQRKLWYFELKKYERELSFPHHTDIELQSLTSLRDERIEIIHTVQEPWCLNSLLAQKIMLA